MKHYWFIDMMKKSYLFLLVFVIGMTLSSCYKDLSTTATIAIPDIVFENEQESIFISYGETLVIDPQVSMEGKSPEDFSYLWEIDFNPPSASNRFVISEEPILELQIAQTPSERPYYVTVVVTDKNSGYSNYKAWPVYVGSSIGEGLVVAYTNDGVTSDLDFVSSARVTYNYEEDEDITYLRSLYSLANETPYQGRINVMNYNIATSGATYNLPRLLVGTDTELFSLSLLTMERELETGELLLLSSSESGVKVDNIFNYAKYISGVIVNNKLYNMTTQMSSMFSEAGFLLEPKNVITKNNSAYGKATTEGCFCFFDCVHDGYYYIRGWTSSSSSIVNVSVNTSYSIADSDCLGAGSLQNDILGFVIKTETGDYRVSTLNLKNKDPEYSEYALDGTDIDNAISFAFCDNATVFYYTTPENIYANVITGDRVTTRRVPWTPDDPEEKITQIIHYQQAWYSTQGYGENDYEFPLDTHRLQMLIVTYNESTGEGKIYLKPFNVNTGLFSMTDEGEVFEGFGEITAIASTPR